MPTLIKCWREAWRQGDFPFLQVQLANFKDVKSEPGESDWAELREAQWLTTQTLSNVGAACITDIGAAKDIHPRDKLNVGKRLARLALHDVYGMSEIVSRGPVYREMKIDGNKIVLKFDTFGSGLASYYNEPLIGFAICGEDRKWVWGEAKITDAETVEVSHSEILSPVAVRYNWADNPQGNLFNELYLPAYPFRTDDWEGITVNKKSP
jgi:sialate O-acetylesterase